MEYSYTVNDYGKMTIYFNDNSVADISECQSMTEAEKNNLMLEVLTELGYIEV